MVDHLYRLETTGVREQILGEHLWIYVFCQRDNYEEILVDISHEGKMRTNST